MSGGCNGACCVQEDRAATPAVGPGEDVANRLGVLGRGATAELLEAAARKPQLDLRVELALVDRTVDHFGDEIRPARGKLDYATAAWHVEHAGRYEPD